LSGGSLLHHSGSFPSTEYPGTGPASSAAVAVAVLPGPGDKKPDTRASPSPPVAVTLVRGGGVDSSDAGRSSCAAIRIDASLPKIAQARMAKPAMDTPQQESNDQQSFLLEENQRFSESLLWQLQRKYFEQQGIEAWRQGAVPHYITSNPHIANAYAQVVLGFLRDCYATSDHKDAGVAVIDPDRPIYILELGSGSGRFAYHFMKKFHAAYAQSSLGNNSVKYILTDFTEQNLNYWQGHRSLQPYLEKGLLDLACFDAENDRSITLSQSGQTLEPDCSSNPMIVIANYVLDTIPQDLFLIENGKITESLVTLASPRREPDLNDAEILSELEVSYTQRAIDGGFYDDPGFAELLKEYQQTLTDTYLLFPHVALRCLNHLRRLCDDRLLLLSGDKGFSREEDLLFRAEPGIVMHGSFSLMVNYHAIGQYVQQQGGKYLTTPYLHNSLNICAAVFGTHPDHYPETSLAFDFAIVQNNPDDFFSLRQILADHYDALSIEQILAYLRLSGWDGAVFMDCFSAITAKLENLPSSMQEELLWAARNIWENYYPIGEQRDLPFYLGILLYTMEYFPEALEYLEQSRQIYGDDPNTLYNMGLCYYRLRQLDRAMECVTQALKQNPEYEAAKAMRIKLKSETMRLNKLAY
jgi:tetratricopeptide (TPR) repeat protein